jgi:hypothetical protein
MGKKYEEKQEKRKKEIKGVWSCAKQTKHVASLGNSGVRHFVRRSLSVACKTKNKQQKQENGRPLYSDLSVSNYLHMKIMLHAIGTLTTWLVLLCLFSYGSPANGILFVVIDVCLLASMI